MLNYERVNTYEQWNFISCDSYFKDSWGGRDALKWSQENMLNTISPSKETTGKWKSSLVLISSKCQDEKE